MKLLVAAFALLMATPADADSLWSYPEDTECLNPAILIADASKIIERLDFECKITGQSEAEKSTVYKADCQTDEPATQSMEITVTPKTTDIAQIKWGDVDDELYRLCPIEPKDIM